MEVTHPGKTSISKMSIRGMTRASIGVCTVRSDAHNVLQDKLIIVCAGGQFLVVVLQTDAAKLAIRPISHDRNRLRIVAA